MSEIQVETTLISKNNNFLVRTYILFWKTCTVLNCNCKSVNLPILIVTNCYLITKKIAKLNFFSVFFRHNQFLEWFFVIGNKIFVGMSREAVCVKNSAYFSLYFFHKTDCVIRTFTKCTKLKLSNSILTAVLKIVS